MKTNEHSREVRDKVVKQLGLNTVLQALNFSGRFFDPHLKTETGLLQ